MVMQENVEDKVRTAHGEIAAVVAQWRVERARESRRGGLASPAKLLDRGAAITNPAGFWGEALASTDSSHAAIEHGVLMAAAKLRAGDLSFVLESGVGQVAWLSALTLELAEDANRQPIDSAARVRLLQLAMRAQGAAAKLMLSLGALASMGAGCKAVVE